MVRVFDDSGAEGTGYTYTHTAEAFNMPICPHFQMELHGGLCAAVPNRPWVENIPQLGAIVKNGTKVEKGYAHPRRTPGLGIEWNLKAIEKLRVAAPAVLKAGGSSASKRR